MKHLICCLLLAADGPVHPHPSQQQATYKVLHTTSCIPNAPEDGHNYFPKHVELTLNFTKLLIVASS